ncbi:MAG TPA: RES family NAD+ phosphorylase [Vitreimonas sp.]|uniref:RES family NAD+ phosphorylase n=1 Tax=Vitreimonas sp. TaxID=3069702 RepID=UPI002D60F688|nr:RES family NAD+ phosphorylase [Vitreimonas sp.]HYD86017.1 RES family NAD+ phosphorylase [Vitreimonas sp.]
MAVATAPGPPLPSDWLARESLPVIEVSALFRVHRSEHHPIFFGPPKNAAPAGRFNCVCNCFRALYAAENFNGALVEGLIRNPGRRYVDPREIRMRSYSSLACSRPLRLIRLFGGGLQQVGSDATVVSGPHEHSRIWSKALWAHGEEADGIAYHARHDDELLCYAIWCRAERFIEVENTRPLSPADCEVTDALIRYNKILTPERHS